VDRSPVLRGWCYRRGHGFAEYFAAYVRDPQSKNLCGDARNSGYDDATSALSSLLRTFSPHAPEGKP